MIFDDYIHVHFSACSNKRLLLYLAALAVSLFPSSGLPVIAAVASPELTFRIGSQAQTFSCIQPGQTWTLDRFSCAHHSLSEARFSPSTMMMIFAEIIRLQIERSLESVLICVFTKENPIASGYGYQITDCTGRKWWSYRRIIQVQMKITRQEKYQSQISGYTIFGCHNSRNVLNAASHGGLNKSRRFIHYDWVNVWFTMYDLLKKDCLMDSPRQ